MAKNRIQTVPVACHVHKNDDTWRVKAKRLSLACSLAHHPLLVLLHIVPPYHHETCHLDFVQLLDSGGKSYCTFIALQLYCSTHMQKVLVLVLPTAMIAKWSLFIFKNSNIRLNMIVSVF